MLRNFDDTYMPSFRPLQCSKCEHTIRGSMFQKREVEAKIEKSNDDKTEEQEVKITTICEGCYRDHHYGDPLFIKSYKHCILRASIHKDESQKICRCSTVPQINMDGSFRELFPVDALDSHRGSAATKGIKCGLLNLGTLVAEAKYQGMLSKHEKQVNLGDQKRLNEIEEQKRFDNEENFVNLGKKVKGMKMANQKSLVDESDRVAEGGESAV